MAFYGVQMGKWYETNFKDVMVRELNLKFKLAI